jgi:hypothetical protein
MKKLLNNLLFIFSVFPDFGLLLFLWLRTAESKPLPSALPGGSALLSLH